MVDVLERKGKITRSSTAISGKLLLVDLAGMESSKKSYSLEGESSKPQRREEAKCVARTSTRTYARPRTSTHVQAHAHTPTHMHSC